MVISKEIFVINSKRKGKVGELEVVNLLKEKGLTARRTQQFSGKADGTSDVICEELKNFHIEVKRARFTLDLDGEGYPNLSVEISEDVSKTFYVKTSCSITEYVGGTYLKPIYDYDELVTHLTNIKNNINFDMECDLESELTSVANNYLKGLLG